jgi:hypothetical protein
MALPPFDSIASARRSLEGLAAAPPRSTGAWDVPHVLQHFAQSVEYSMTGFPQLKPAWFRHSVGPMAFAVFARRGRMSHGLDAAIPGAPDIAQGLPLEPAVARAVAALDAFAGFTGPLQPHFAYGALDKPQFAQAHVMHLANHWQAFELR